MAWTCQTAQATRAESTEAYTGRGRPHRFDLETFHGDVPWNRSRRSIRDSHSPASSQSYCWDWLVEPTLKATTAAVLSARHGSNRRSGKSVDVAPNG